MTEETEHFMGIKQIQFATRTATIIIAISSLASLTLATASARGIPRAQAHEAASADSSDKSVPSSSDPEYVIGTQDLLAINVWHEPELSRSVPVRPDGKISMPLVGDLEVRGLTPRMVQAQLTKQLEAYIRKPEVTVIVQEANSHKFFVMGEVQRPGAYPLTSSMTVLDGLATAGGFKDFAKVNKIVILRTLADGSRERLSFQYKQAIKGGKSSPALQLMPGDTVIVP